MEGSPELKQKEVSLCILENKASWEWKDLGKQQKHIHWVDRTPVFWLLFPLMSGEVTVYTEYCPLTPWLIPPMS